MHPTVRNVVLFGQRGFQISDLFGNGLYAGFDFTDLERTKVWGPSSLPLLYSDLANTNISASAQTVNLALDKSKGLTFGSNLGSDGEWDTYFGAASGGSASGGVVTFTPNAGSPGWFGGSIGGFTVGDVVRMEFRIDSVTSGNSFFRADPSGITGTGYFAVTNPTLGSTIVRYFRLTGTTLYWGFGINSGATGVGGGFSVKVLPGNHGLQTTSGSRPAYTESGALRYLACDGVDDGLISSLAPASGMTVAVCGRGATAGTYAIGAQTGVGTDRSLGIGLGTGGVLALALGAKSIGASDIVGSTDIRNSDFVGLARCNGVGTADLYLNGSVVSTGSATGTIQTGTPYAIGATNNAGTLAGFWNGRVYRAVAVQRFIPDSMVLPLMRALGAGVVSF